MRSDDPTEQLVITSVRLPADMLAELEVHAAHYRHGRSEIIREAIADRLQALRQGGS